MVIKLNNIHLNIILNQPLFLDFTYKFLHCVMLFLRSTSTRYTQIYVTYTGRKIFKTSSLESLLSKENYDSKRKWHSDQQIIENKKVLMMRRRRARIDRCIIRKARIHSIERKLRMLKKLVPNYKSMGSVEVLFRETVEYIMALQTRVKLMQIAADILSGSAESDHQYT